LPISVSDMPNRCNSVAFWANFWYKWGHFTGSILIWAWISAVVRIGSDRVHHCDQFALGLWCGVSIYASSIFKF
ncbi:MAG: hypothetical protein KAQ99_09795, partial [Candidatus Aureabacteria bacterium]|nr:hypothetical protein [Candidatus Auribacterota bacterium]